MITTFGFELRCTLIEKLIMATYYPSNTQIGIRLNSDTIEVCAVIKYPYSPYLLEIEVAISHSLRVPEFVGYAANMFLDGAMTILNEA